MSSNRKPLSEMAVSEVQGELADAVMATVWCGKATRNDRGWSVHGLVPANGSEGVYLWDSNGSNPQIPRDFEGKTFEATLRSAVEGGADTIGDPVRRYGELLEAWKVQGL